MMPHRANTLLSMLPRDDDVPPVCVTSRPERAFCAVRNLRPGMHTVLGWFWNRSNCFGTSPFHVSFNVSLRWTITI